MEHLLLSFKKVFGDMPSRTTCCYHDVDVGDSPPIKQHLYRMNPIKLEQMRKEIDYICCKTTSQNRATVTGIALAYWYLNQMEHCISIQTSVNSIH